MITVTRSSYVTHDSTDEYDENGSQSEDERGFNLLDLTPTTRQRREEEAKKRTEERYPPLETLFKRILEEHHSFTLDRYNTLMTVRERVTPEFIKKLQLGKSTIAQFIQKAIKSIDKELNPKQEQKQLHQMKELEVARSLNVNLFNEFF
jgi:hypothetical protein